MSEFKLPTKGSAEIKGYKFFYELSRTHKKAMAPPDMRYLKIIFPYRSVKFAGTAKIRNTVWKDAAQFNQACKSLMKKILENNNILLDAIYEENS